MLHSCTDCNAQQHVQTELRTDQQSVTYASKPILCVQESTCVGSVKPFNLNKLISKKTCKDCSEAVLEPIELPEVGELMPGETVVKGEVTTQIAAIE